MASVSARQASDQTRRPTPLERYQEDLKRSDFQYDSAQEQAVKHLQREDRTEDWPLCWVLPVPTMKRVVMDLDNLASALLRA